MSDFVDELAPASPLPLLATVSSTYSLGLPDRSSAGQLDSAAPIGGADVRIPLLLGVEVRW